MPRVQLVRRIPVAVVLLALTLVFGVSSASGVPAQPSAGAAGGVAKVTAGAKAAALKLGAAERRFGIRAPDVANANSPETVYDAVQAGSQATVARSKTTITLPPSVVLTYVRTCGKLQTFDENGKPSFIQFCCPDVTTTKGCNPAFVVQAPRTNRDDYVQPPGTNASLGWTRVTGPIWAASPPGSSRPYGIFPAAKVRLLAFGAIPATATVQLSQPVVGGAVQPLQYFDLTLGVNSPPGTVVQGFPEAKDQNSILIAQRYLRGRVDVRLTDVRIDGRPLDVGSQCQATGAELSYTAPRGEQGITAVASELRGRPGEFDALSSNDPGTAGASIVVPAFRGCRDGARNLNPLITSLASGRSRVGLALRTGAAACDADFNPLRGCPAYPGYDGPVNGQPTGLARALSKLPRREARRIVAALPAALRREVPKTYR